MESVDERTLKDEVQVSIGILGIAAWTLWAPFSFFLEKIFSPAVWIHDLVLWIQRKRKRFAEGRYNFDSRNKIDSLVFRVLRSVWRLRPLISGIISADQYAKRLLVWEPRIPIKGYTESTLLFEYSYVGKEIKTGENPFYQAAGRWADFGASHSHSKSGKFIILRKGFDERGRLLISCLWISGPKIGKRFSVTEMTGVFDYSEDQPTTIQLLPSFVPVSLEILGSVSVLLAIFAFSKEVLGPIVNAVMGYLIKAF